MADLTMYNARISVLWLLAIVAFFAYGTLAASEIPSNFSNLSLVNDQDVAGISIVMVALAFLSLVLKGSTSRWTNVIGGILVGIGVLVTFLDGITVNFYGFYNLMMGADVVIVAAIIWFAYKTPRITS